MNTRHPSNGPRQQQRARAVKTAWLLGVIAAAVFAAFVGSAILGR